MNSAERVEDAYERFARAVVIIALTAAFAGLGSLERFAERHPAASKILGLLALGVYLWALLELWQALHGIV